MKKYSLIFAMALGAFLFTVNASAYFNVAPMPENNKAIVEVTVPDNSRTSLFIHNPEGFLVHGEIINPGENNTKIFDLSTLGDGVYKFKSEMDFITTTKQIELKNSTAEVISKVVEFSPAFSMKGENLLINLLNLEQEYIKLAIESDYTIYHEGNEGNSPTFHKMVDVSNLSRGEYYAVITVGEKTFRHAFKVN